MIATSPSTQQNRTKKIGVLNLQGAVSEHLTALEKLENVISVAIKDPKQLDEIDGLIIPGGESTAISRLIRKNGLFEPIQAFAKAGKPILGTCAGLVLCGKSTANNEVEVLDLIDITVERNGFGRQVDSFETALDIEEVGKDISAIFIRAPYIRQTGDKVKTLASVDNRCVMAQQDNVIVCSFHPELTDDDRILRYFVNLI